MFRKFLLTAMVAVVASLAAPATSQASFAIKVDVYNATINGDGSFNQGAAIAGSPLIIADEGSVGTSTFFGLSNALESASTQGEANTLDYSKTLVGPNIATGLRLDIQSNSNSPGGSISSIWETISRLVNNTANNYRVVITLADTGFQTVGGQTLGQFFLQTTADANQSGVTAGSKATAGSKVIYDTNQEATDGEISFTGPINPAQTQSTTPKYFTRTTNVDMTLIGMLTFDVKAGGTSELSSRTMLAAPAPAGLVLVATMLPFAGLLRRRLRKCEVATAA